MKNIVLVLLSLIMLTAVNFAKAETCQESEQLLKEGDLVFFGINHSFYKELAKATKSWASHVGIVIRGPQGQWQVAESLVPYSRVTKFCSFIERGYKSYFEIYRLKKALKTSQIQVLHQQIKVRLKKPYDVWFDYQSPKQFCSKFVYDIFYQTTKTEIGLKQSFEDLKALNPDYDFKIWKYWFGGKIPWNQVTITPASQLNDKDLYRIYRSNLINPFNVEVQSFF